MKHADACIVRDEPERAQEIVCACVWRSCRVLKGTDTRFIQIKGRQDFFEMQVGVQINRIGSKTEILNQI